MSLQQFLTILWTRKWLVLAYLLATMATTLVLSLIMPKVYISTASLVLDQRVIDPMTGESLPTQLMSGYIATQTDIISSHYVATKVVDALKLEEDKSYRSSYAKTKGAGLMRDWIAEALLEDLTVKPSRESSIIQVGYSSTNPKLAAKIANAFATAYIRTTVDLRVQPAKQSADWFEEQLNTLREKMEKTRQSVSDFQQSHGIVNTTERLDLEDSKLSELTRQLAISQGRSYELESRKKQLVPALENQRVAESMHEIAGNEFIRSLRIDLSRAETKRAELAVNLGRNHPEYQRIEGEITLLKQRIASEIKSVLSGFDNVLASSKSQDSLLANAINEQKIKVLQLRKAYDEIALLNREAENAQKAYDSALQRSVQTRLESNVRQSNIVVLNQAVPPSKHAKPQIFLNMALALFLGTVLGIGAALLAEKMDRRVRLPLDITDSLGVPVFGVVTVAQKHTQARKPREAA